MRVLFFARAGPPSMECNVLSTESGGVSALGLCCPKPCHTLKAHVCQSSRLQPTDVVSAARVASSPCTMRQVTRTSWGSFSWVANNVVRRCEA